MKSVINNIEISENPKKSRDNFNLIYMKKFTIFSLFMIVLSNLLQAQVRDVERDKIQVNNLMAFSNNYTTANIKFSTKGIAVNKQDSLALIAFYNSTNGANWVKKWDLTKPVKTWRGVSIGDKGRVVVIDLYSNNLTGTIPSEIGNLNNLTTLILNNNHLTGTIPSEIGNLSNLKVLLLNNNQLKGSIPAEIVNLKELYWFYLSNNHFDELPNLSSLVNLTQLRIQNNNFTFEDIEYNIGVASTMFDYHTQAKVGRPQSYTLNNGDNLTLSANVGGTANIYQWYKNNEAIIGETSSNYQISNFSLISDAGIYTYKLINTVVGGLTLESCKIYVNILTPVYTIKVYSSEGGSVKGGGTYKEDLDVTVTAVANAGYRFVSWTNEENVILFGNPFTFTATKDCSLVANFERINKP